VTYRAKEHYRDAEVAATYDDERFTSRKGRLVDQRERSLIANAIWHAGADRGAQILDVPCGTGRLARSLAEEGYVVTGIDVSDAMLARAAERMSDLPPSEMPTLVVGDAEALPFADATFDIVISLRLLGHLPPATRSRALLEFRRVSRGFVVVAFYHRDSVQGLLRRRKRGGTWHPVRLRELDAELRAAGLRRVHRQFLLPAISETVVVLAKPV
jgi:ubiquinone/menaquinone biosynthesis C-methylase UbiE